MKKEVSDDMYREPPFSFILSVLMIGLSRSGILPGSAQKLLDELCGMLSKYPVGLRGEVTEV